MRESEVRESLAGVKMSPFSIYLRTGRRVTGSIQTKFNPWHDPDDGRFTFAGRGDYFPRGVSDAQDSSRGQSGQTRRSHASQATGREPSRDGLYQHIVSPGEDEFQPDRHNDPADPRNHSIYIVRRGDSLTRIAHLRKGLRVADLALLNGLPIDRPLRIGQQIKLPDQRFLDEGREAKNRFLALTYYMETHGGRLPPDVAHPPSLESQILDSGWSKVTKNGYDFEIDVISRTGFRAIVARSYRQTIASQPSGSRRHRPQAKR